MLSGYWFIIEHDSLWLERNGLPEFTLLEQDVFYLVGQLNQKPCYVAKKMAFSDQQLKNLAPMPFKQSYNVLSPDIFKLALRAKALLHWLEIHQYCGLCGQATLILSPELARQCERCAQLFYPKTAPSVIAVIERQDEILLARSPRFAPGLYSCIAGFIEPGETAEETLEREVLEEVGLKINNIRYVASQHWPFPNSFMIGFFADYESGDIKIDNVEITDAQWFKKDNLPILPTGASIARKLIQDWISRQSCL